MISPPKTFSEITPYIYRSLRESFGGQTIEINDEYIYHSEFGFEQKIKYQDIKEVRTWFGTDPRAIDIILGGIRKLYIILDLIQENSKPIEIKQSIKRALYKNKYEPLDMSIIYKIQEKNPNTKIDKHILDYIKTGDISHLTINTIYEKELKPIVYLVVILLALLIIQAIIALI